jgi:translocation and assembly module TamB
VNTKQGQISLSGNADWTQIDNWRAQVAAKGSRVRITVPPMVRLDVSPDVVFTATPSLFSLDGSVDVPGRVSWSTKCRKAPLGSLLMK